MVLARLPVVLSSLPQASYLYSTTSVPLASIRPVMSFWAFRTNRGHQQSASLLAATPGHIVARCTFRQLTGMSAGSNRYFYVRNAQNDIIALIDENGTEVVRYEYDAWGNPISTTGTLAGTIGKRNPFRYRGYYWDEETGMYYLESRYYDPEIRRFISADSVMLTSLAGTNLYM